MRGFAYLSIVFALSLALVSPSWADFRSPSEKVSFLGYLRRTYPDLYQDFMIRFNAAEFLDDAQNAVDKIRFNPDGVEGLHIDVLDNSQMETAIHADAIDLDRVLVHWGRFIERFPGANEILLEQALHEELLNEIPLDGLMTALFRSNILGNAREVMGLPTGPRLRILREKLTSLVHFPGLNPRLLGLDQDTLSGREFLNLYIKALRARERTSFLIPLYVLAQHRGLNKITVAGSASAAQGLDEQAFAEVFGANEFLTRTQVIARELVTRDARLNLAKVAKLFKMSYENVRATAMHGATESGRLLLTLTRSHPFDAWIRGSVGDCATFNAYPISMVSNENIYWILKPDGRVRGYLQFTRAQSEGENIIYVNTISGSGVSSADARVALAALQANLPALGAAKIVLPVAELIPHIINFPEIANVYMELIANGRKAPIQYLDARERSALAPFIEDKLDQPASNQWGVEIPAALLKRTQESYRTQTLRLNRAERFPDISQTEILLVTLDLRNREADRGQINQVLSHYGIAATAFEGLWKALSNPGRLPVAAFHENVQEAMAKMNLNLEWSKFKDSPLLFRGHFAAPDALKGINLNLAMKYCQTYLSSFSDIGSVYQTLSPHFTELTKHPQFVNLIRSLFRKNLKELDRVLDFYELEHKSAYRTLALLFTSGLSSTPFEDEIARLHENWESAQPQVNRQDGIFIRRVTLLGMIHNYDRLYFQQLMDRLQTMKREKRRIDPDDVSTVSQYFAEFASHGASRADLQTMQNFMTSSRFGRKFISQIGHFAIDRFDVPRMFEVMIRAGEIAGAARLVHREPWPKHALAGKWAAQLWANRAKLGNVLLLQGLKATPSWVDVAEVGPTLNGLMEFARKNDQDEKILMRAFLRRPERLTPSRIEWLANLSTEDLAREALRSITAAWPPRKARAVRTAIARNFPTLVDPAFLPSRSSKCADAALGDLP